MGKISPVAAKYIVRAQLDANGVIEKPDVVGAIFGQTEGLLGSDLELRELQKSGRIGRIEVNVESKSGKTSGIIEIPSSMDKAETAIIAASLETIDRIGPCTATMKTLAIEDVRISKRKYIIDRARELLKSLINDMLPDSLEITEEVRESVRASELVFFGPDKVPAGPGVYDSDEMIIVEGRADVVNLLRNGIKNVIAIEGTHVPKTVADLSRQRTTTLFVDGDRGGDLIFKEIKQVTEVDFIARAPTGKEVEELTKKELHKCLRARVATEQVTNIIDDVPTALPEDEEEGPSEDKKPAAAMAPRPVRAPVAAAPREPVKLEDSQKEILKGYVSEIIGTRGAYLLDDKMQLLGKVPISEMSSALAGVEKIGGLIVDGVITARLLEMLKYKPVRFVVGMKIVGAVDTKDIKLITPQDLGL